MYVRSIEVKFTKIKMEKTGVGKNALSSKKNAVLRDVVSK